MMIDIYEWKLWEFFCGSDVGSGATNIVCMLSSYGR